jgi:hypothetical protein
MKKLKLKMKDLTNPTILTHHEIKNILGGSGTHQSCEIVCYSYILADFVIEQVPSCAATNGYFSELCNAAYGASYYDSCNCNY